jgi:hypothetical protein
MIGGVWQDGRRDDEEATAFTAATATHAARGAAGRGGQIERAGEPDLNPTTTKRSSVSSDRFARRVGAASVHAQSRFRSGRPKHC